MKVEYDGNLPEEVKSIWLLFEPGFKKASPPWVLDLKVEFDARDDKNTIKITSQPNYSRATICICPCFITNSMEQRLRSVMHEVAHLHAWKLMDVKDEMVKIIASTNKDLSVFVDNHYMAVLEAYCEDFGRVFGA